MWINQDRRWKRIASTPRGVFEALQDLTRRQHMGGPIPSPLDPWDGIPWAYRQEPEARQDSPRAGNVDDRWSTWWEVPIIGGHRIADCEDQSTATAAALQDDGIDARPAVLHYPEHRLFHVVAVVPAQRGERAIIPARDRVMGARLYAGDDWQHRPLRVIDPNWRTGMYIPGRGYHPRSTAYQRGGGGRLHQ